jgi:hypothetical protein
MTVAQKSEKIKHYPSAKVGFASAVVLAAGLALTPSCSKTEKINQPRSTESSYSARDLADQRVLLQKITEMARRSPELLRQSNIDESSLSKLKAVTARLDVKIGDEVHGGLFDNATVPFRITKIDDNGVAVSGQLFEYGRPSTLEVTSGGSFLLTSIVRAGRGPNGTAIISLTTIERF